MALLALMAIAAGCGSSSTATSPSSQGSTTSTTTSTTVATTATTAPKNPVKVVASTNVWGDIASRIAGDKAEIVSIISSPDADPHSYQANPQTQLALSRADIVIENGGGYDDFVDTMLGASNNSKVKLLNAVTISGFTPNAEGELNEHVWYDFGTVAKVTDQLVAALSAADPGDSAAFSANGAAFKKQLDQLRATEDDIKKAHAGQGVMVTEPVPLYLLEACGLEDKTPAEFSEAIEEGTDVPPTVLKKTLSLLRGGGVKLLAYNEQTAGPETEQVLTAAKSSNVAVVPVTETLPDGKNYVDWMTANLTAVRGALGG